MPLSLLSRQIPLSARLCCFSVECSKQASTVFVDNEHERFICAQKDLIDQGSKWQIRDGQSVSLFHDVWVGDGMRLLDFRARQLIEKEEFSCVGDWLKDNSWDFDRLAGVLTKDIVWLRFLVWGGSYDGCF